MNGNDMIEAMGYVAEDLILNTETIKKSNKRTFRWKIPLKESDPAKSRFSILNLMPDIAPAWVTGFAPITAGRAA